MAKLNTQIKSKLNPIARNRIIPDRVRQVLAVLGMPVVAAMIALMAASFSMAQDIYKTVDEDGNTVYTDQKPSEDALPVKLKELTVVDPLDLGDEAAVSGAESADGSDGEPAFGLTIVSPADEETIWNTAYTMTVDVSAERQLPSGTRLAYLIDGEVRMTTRSMSVELEEVFRGERQLSVELRNSDGAVLGRAGPVTFYMRQHSRLHPNPG